MLRHPIMRRRGQNRYFYRISDSRGRYRRNPDLGEDRQFSTRALLDKRFKWSGGTFPVRSWKPPKSWCCRWGSNLRPLPYQGSALPLSYGSPRVRKLSLRAPPALAYRPLLGKAGCLGTRRLSGRRVILPLERTHSADQQRNRDDHGSDSKRPSPSSAVNKRRQREGAKEEHDVSGRNFEASAHAKRLTSSAFACTPPLRRTWNARGPISQAIRDNPARRP